MQLTLEGMSTEKSFFKEWPFLHVRFDRATTHTHTQENMHTHLCYIKSFYMKRNSHKLWYIFPALTFASNTQTHISESKQLM